MNNSISTLRKFWKYLKRDTWDSWLVSIILAFILIKFVFFPVLSLISGAPLPLVVVESCSMYHSADFEHWWDQNSQWYEQRGIGKEQFEDFSFNEGLNKGDIIFVWARGEYKVGDIIIFNSDFRHPLIHRLIQTDKNFGTKGDNNFDQLPQEVKINSEDILGKSVLRVPGLGWLKLIFFEGLREDGQRGFCK